MFKGAVGVLDGTFVHAAIPMDMQIPYMEEKVKSAIRMF